MVCLRNICINTLHKGDNEDDNNNNKRMILKSELNARNKITAIGALAVAVLRYSFRIINWKIEEIKKNRQEN